MLKPLTVAALFAVCPTVASAEDTVRDILRIYTSSPEGRRNIEASLGAVANGIYWSNVYFGEKTGHAFVCVKEGQLIQGDDAVSMLRVHAKRYPKAMDLPVGLGMVAALSQKFPCEGAN